MRYAILATVLAGGILATLMITTSASAEKGNGYATDEAKPGFVGAAGVDKERPRAPREPQPQVVFECLPVEILFNENDLILVCEQPLIIGDEVINNFSVRHNKRFSASAVTLYTTAMNNGQWLLLSVDETNPLRDRCLDGCRRVNEVTLAAPGSNR